MRHHHLLCAKVSNYKVYYYYLINCTGIIDFLISSDPHAGILRDNLVFKISQFLYKYAQLTCNSHQYQC